MTAIAVQVREIDQAFQLIDARPKLFEGQRPGAELGERRVDLPEDTRRDPRRSPTW